MHFVINSLYISLRIIYSALDIVRSVWLILIFFKNHVNYDDQ